MVYGQNYMGYPNQFGTNQQAVMSSNMSQPQFTIQNGGFVSVTSEEEARRYPVAPGNSVTFKNENAPYVYTKTMGFSQLDRPLFEIYRLVKEEDTLNQISENKKSDDENKEYLSQEDLDPLVKDIKNIQTKIKTIDSVLEELKSSCNNSVKQVTTSAKSVKNTEKGAKS